MADQEVGIIEINEGLRLWMTGLGKKPISRKLGIDPRTDWRYTALPTPTGCGRRTVPQH